MRYRVTHRTTFRYASEVALAHNQIHLSPRAVAGRQSVFAHEVEVEPSPAVWTAREDYFGNATALFSVRSPHREMRVTAVTELEVLPPALTAADFDASPAWETVSDRAAPSAHGGDALHWRDVRPFAAASPWVQRNLRMTAYARDSFTPGRPVLAAAAELMRRIYTDFEYKPGATQVDTPAIEAFDKRVGVCQDFAHVMLAMLCGLGLPSRYVSGYLRTVPIGGDERGGIETLTGADASHAWVSVFDGRETWVDFDPTNNKPADTDHVTTAWGRDYRDVVPVRGRGAGQRVGVEVEVTPLGYLAARRQGRLPQGRKVTLPSRPPRAGPAKA